MVYSMDIRLLSLTITMVLQYTYNDKNEFDKSQDWRDFQQ